MAPLVPDIIGNEFNLAIAFLIGIAFGFVLEQAGFSSTKKLVGLFYGYDFTVLKVFFTAGVTAMIGVFALGHFGQLDLGLIYINPTFLNSAIIGGLIMGTGFIIGGFCPGTSLCAMAIGKIDAFWFVFGGILGVFLFTETYPQIHDMYVAHNMGNLKISTFFGISDGLFAFLLTAIAVLAFYFTQKIQDKVNGIKPAYTKQTIVKYAVLAALPFVALAIVWLSPNHEQRIAANIEKQINSPVKEITSDKLAFELINNYYQMNLIDVRSPKEFAKYHLPLAINVPLDSMLNREWRKFFAQQYKRNVFYGDNAVNTKKAFFMAQLLGGSNDCVLADSHQKFRQLVLEAKEPVATAAKDDFMKYEFRRSAALTINELAKKMKNQNSGAQKTIKKVKGGCS
jgi:rhodanese-related sulfurtransferase/uncharacterized protein with PQ loop repeat